MGWQRRKAHLRLKSGCKKPLTFELGAISKGSSGKGIPVEEQAEFKEQSGGQCTGAW